MLFVLPRLYNLFSGTTGTIIQAFGKVGSAHRHGGVGQTGLSPGLIPGGYGGGGRILDFQIHHG